MTPSALSSALLGAALALANVAASVALLRMSRGRGQRAFLTLVFGGMALRMMAVLAVVAAVLLFVPVRPGAFVGGLLAVFALGLVGEVVVYGRAARA